MASSGAWMGSDVESSDIRKLRRGRFLGLTEEVRARAPSSDEISPNPEEGEFVVFSTHLERGLGLPASPFLQEFLRLYGLQPHHLGANSLTQLSCFVTLCEAYLGIWPCIEIFSMLLYLRA